MAHLVVAASAAVLVMLYATRSTKLIARVTLGSAAPALTTTMRFVLPARRMGRNAWIAWMTPRVLTLN